MTGTRKMRMKDFYEKSGISSSLFSQYATGATATTILSVNKMADALQISVEELLKGIEEIKEHPTTQTDNALTDAQLKFALWGDTDVIDDADLEDVRRYAAFIKARKEQK